MMSNIVIYCRDKMPKTTESVIATIKEYMEKESKIEGGKYLLAGGAVGVRAAVRDEIAQSQALNLALALFGCLLFCALNFRSSVAGHSLNHSLLPFPISLPLP